MAKKPAPPTMAPPFAPHGRAGHAPRQEHYSAAGNGQDERSATRYVSARQSADDQPRRRRQRRPEFAEGRRTRTDAARRHIDAREDHAFRPRAHSRARGACARRSGARRLPGLRGPVRTFLCAGLPRPQGPDAGIRAILDRRRLARLGRHAARCARLRGEVLYSGRRVGPGRQQHAGLLHPGRQQISRPDPRGEARAPQRDPAGRRLRTTRSGISCR